jgi:hypothetical protein
MRYALYLDTAQIPHPTHVADGRAVAVGVVCIGHCLAGTGTQFPLKNWDYIRRISSCGSRASGERQRSKPTGAHFSAARRTWRSEMLPWPWVSCGIVESPDHEALHLRAELASLLPLLKPTTHHPSSLSIAKMRRILASLSSHTSPRLCASSQYPGDTETLELRAVKKATPSIGSVWTFVLAAFAIVSNLTEVKDSNSCWCKSFHTHQ